MTETIGSTLRDRMKQRPLILESGFRSAAGHEHSTAPVTNRVINHYSAHHRKQCATIDQLAMTHAESIRFSWQALGHNIHNFQTCPCCNVNGRAFQALVRQSLPEQIR